MADTTNPTLDLRPKAGSILYAMLRLGLVFDHSDDGTAQTWYDYNKNLMATFDGPDATNVTLVDMTSRLSTTLPVSELAQVTEIITWKSGTETGEQA